MFDSGVEKTIIGVAIVLWFAHGWYLNERLQHVHKKLDSVLDSLNGLREYLYEIDSQFNDERESQMAFEGNESMFSGMDDLRLVEEKERAGKRTLNTTFITK